jgi:hypothetical protein
MSLFTATTFYNIQPAIFSAIGGQNLLTVSGSNTFMVHYFTSSGNFTVLSGTENVEYLIVAGGGGSAEFSGAGGAGGVLTGSLSVTPQTYSFVVGGGGPARLDVGIGNAGTGSTAFSLTTIGGGAGAGSSVALAGGTGGSGGGGSARNGGAGSGTSPQGRNGGTGRPGYTSGNDGGSGGGGGFSAVGANGGFRAGGNGGNGINLSDKYTKFLGDSGSFAGGGGGFGDARNGAATRGLGGIGGGGDGASGVLADTSNEPGQPNTGGGAGAGCANGDGKAGGSGIIIVRYPFGSIDTDSQAFLNATSITDTTISTAINNLVIDLKDAGLWNLMDAIYPMVGGTSTTHKFNLKNPADTDAAFRLNFQGGWTHDSSGAKPDGVSGTYADTFAVPNTLFTTTDGSFSYYSFTNNAAADDVEIGANDGAATTGECLIALRFSDDNQYSFFGQVGGGASAGSTSSGYFISNRTANVEGWRNGTRVINTGTTVTTITARRLYLAAQNNGTTSNRNSSRGCCFSHIGKSLPTGGPAIFTNIVNNFQKTLQRNVF